jgi:mannose-6-phosphate isomerase
MFYPFKFQPVYKDYIWGGRNFEKLGKTLPKGIVAESWEVSCHPDGVSIIENGEFRGIPLPSMVDIYGRILVGTALPEKDLRKFPLLVKFIDANKDLSVQVHPDDNYANTYENGEYGKNEMWYIMSAEPGAKLIYDVVPGTTRESFRRAVEEDNIEHCLKSMEVFPGDVINIPSGLIHAIGKGILLAEIQQNSNTTYRVYDYNRTDKNGSKRPLHIGKALDVIDFDASGRKEKYRGLEISAGADSSKKFLIANSYFSVACRCY